MSVSATSSKPAHVAAPKTPAPTPKPSSGKSDAAADAGASKKASAPSNDATSGAHAIKAADATTSMAGKDASNPGATNASGAPMHHATVLPPAKGDPRFVDGSTGARAATKDSQPTVTIPDGAGFGGLQGRKQNADDKSKNNYGVTDANFNNQLGVLAKDPDTGEPMNYVKDIQTYNAAGYIETYSPSVYQKLANNQNAGRGTILGAAAHIMGLVQTADPAEAGVDTSSIPMTVPGTNLDARKEVANPKDDTGQDWARMHHAESHWGMFKSLTEMGVPLDKAQEFSGDDAVSGSGRLNGVNGQDGTSGFNAGELQVYQDAAKFDPSGKVILTMMQGHNHDTGIAPDQITNPNIDKQLGLPEGDRDVTAARAAAIAGGLNNGAVRNETNNNDNAANDNNDAPEPDVTAAEATVAGGGAIQTADEADPVTALASIGEAGFADGISGLSSVRLAGLLQQLLLVLLQGGQLDPAILQSLQALVPQLQASTDPELQQMGQAIDAIGKGVDPATGTLSPELVQKLAPVITAFVAATGAAFTPELTAAAPELVQQAQAAAAAAGTAGAMPGMPGMAGATDPTTGAALAQPGGASLPLAGAGGATGANAGATTAGTTTATTAATTPAVATTTTKPPVTAAASS